MSVALALVGASRTLDIKCYDCNMVPPVWEMAGADGLQLRARFEELYETNNILAMRNLLCTSQLDLNDEDSCDRIHNTNTHEHDALSGMHVDTCPRSTPAVLPLTKERAHQDSLHAT